MADYVLGIDQSTQGTKALLFNMEGTLIARADLAHRQIIDSRGWVEHDLNEIYHNTVQTVKNLVQKAGIDKSEIRVLGISNQRETGAAWNRRTGEPVYNAVVWQCARGAAICEELAAADPEFPKLVRSHTGLNLSPYFTAAKLAWILQNVPAAQEAVGMPLCGESPAAAKKPGTTLSANRSGSQKAAAATAADFSNDLCMGTIDSWLVFRLTGGKKFCTDYSNASRTQLFNIHTLAWDEEICGRFGIPLSSLPELTDSDGDFGETDFDGWLEKPIPIRGVLGDSHGALFGQNCRLPGQIKTTYGTGSSIMMNIGDQPMKSNSVVTSIGWKIGGNVTYVLEGNINYTGAVISWMKEDLHLISSAGETEEIARAANPEDTTYLVPAFSGLGAPYWNTQARALFCGMSRSTTRAELIKAGLESIAYQITDILRVMSEESGIEIRELRVDGGPTKNAYLMQFQSDLAGIPVLVPDAEELSGIGAAYCAGIAAGFYDADSIFSGRAQTCFAPQMDETVRDKKYAGWKDAVRRTLGSYFLA